MPFTKGSKTGDEGRKTKDASPLSSVLRPSSITRLTYLYLTIPFIIFCIGWLRLSVAIPVIAIIIWAVWQIFKITPINRFSTPDSLRSSLFYFLLITALWIFLSGVGGYAFQNWDHNWRNAVLHDLVSRNWPVIYSSPERGPVTMLVYYVGYWLPAALAGSLFGWSIASLIMFLWTWLGVILTVLHLNLKLKTSLFKAALLLIFFSGMDAIGALLFAGYPTLWPPIQHLEVWAGNLQYSAFTTQLFWVFNQAVPAWLCIVLILDSPILESNSLLFDRQKQASALQSLLFQKTFIWALSFFFAPLASIGLLIYLSMDWLEQIPEMIKNRFKGIRIDILFASGVIVIISYLFFSSNTAAQERGFQTLAFKDALVFFLLEGGILWLVLAPSHWRNPRWVITGLLLLVIPFIKLGNGYDFVMRASIAPLFYLMIMTGETIFEKSPPQILRFTLYALLLVGALTPLYEVNRSIYRTFEYYFLLDESQRAQPSLEPAASLEKAIAPEAEHPNAILADDIYSFILLQDKITKNFVANVRQSLYYRYISTR